MQTLLRSIAGAISSEQLGWELGWTMVYFVLAGALLWGFAALLKRAMRSFSPQARYVASLFCLSLLAFLAPATFLAVRTNPEALMLLRPAAIPAKLTGATGEAIGIKSPFADNSWRATKSAAPGDRLAAAWREFRAAMMDEKLAPALSTILPRLPWIWLVGSSLMLLYFSFGLMGADRLRRECDSLEQDDLGGLLNQLRREMGVSQRVLIGMSDRVAAPLVLGVMRPMILLPVSVVSNLSVDQLEFVLLHELAHVRRHDNFINLLQRFVEAIAFFHPAAWRISAWVRLERELCCDAAVLARRSSRSAYAETLASLAMPGISAPYAVASLANHQLVSRVRHIMQAKEPSMRFSSRWFVATAMALLTTGGFVAAFAQHPDKPEQKTPEVKAALENSITIEVQLDEQGTLQLVAKPEASYESVAEVLKTLAGKLEKDGKHPKIKVKGHGHGQEVPWKEFTAQNCQACHTNVPAKGETLAANVTFSLDDTCQPGVAQWLELAAVTRGQLAEEPKFSATVDPTHFSRVHSLQQDVSLSLDFAGRTEASEITVAAPAWAVTQATGAPNTFVYGDQNTAWASKTPDGQGEWLLLTYEQPVEVNAVMIHETFNPGAVARVDAILPDNQVIVLWSGEPEAVKTDTPRLFLCKPKKSVKAAKIRVTIASDVVGGWNEIDAVGIIDADGKVHWAKEAAASSSYTDGSKSAAVTLGDRLLSYSAEFDVRPQIVSGWLADEAKPQQGATFNDAAVERLQGLQFDISQAKPAPVQQEFAGTVDLLLNLNAKTTEAKPAPSGQSELQFLGLKLAEPTAEPTKSDSDKLKQIESELEGLLKQLESLRAKMKSK